MIKIALCIVSAMGIGVIMGISAGLVCGSLFSKKILDELDIA